MLNGALRSLYANIGNENNIGEIRSPRIFGWLIWN